MEIFKEISIRFNLVPGKIKRNFKNGIQITGTEQLTAIVSFYPAVKINTLPDGGKWEQSENKLNTSKKGGYITYGWADAGKSTEEREKMISKGKYFRGYKVNINGELIQYKRIKFNTGLYILRESWHTKEQVASAPYEFVNNEIAKIIHITETTFRELIQRIDFSTEKMLLTVKERIKSGMPVNIVVSVNKATSPSKTFEIVEKELKRHDGITFPDENNPKGVPEDLRDFIPFYHANRKKPNKLSSATIDRQKQFKNKLQRWFEATGKKLTLTGSEIEDVEEFIEWRKFDNEENNVRRTKNITSKDQISRVKSEAVGVGTLNKTKKDIIFFYNRAVANFSCRPKFSTKNEILVVQNYDREMADIYLSIDQLLEILKLKLEKETRIEKHRALFVLGCLGGGYRISDLIKLPKPEFDEFDDEKRYYTFDVKSTKTDTKTRAPIPPEMNYLIESFPFETVIKEEELRDDIKELGLRCGWTAPYSFDAELADGTSKTISKPYYKMMMPRTCRKTYCSLLYNFWELPIKECMEFSGHASPDEFFKYLRIDKKAKAQKLINRFKVKPIFTSI